jgi:hypothetical protein
MTGTALVLDSDARPLPPWKQRDDLSPRSPEWERGAGAQTMAAWRTRYEAMPPAEQARYQARYPAPLYWFWFYLDPGIGRTLLIVATFPLWMLVWALVSTVRGAASRER